MHGRSTFCSNNYHNILDWWRLHCYSTSPCHGLSRPTRNPHPPYIYQPSGWQKKIITNHTFPSDACMRQSIFNQSSFNMVYFYSVILIANHSCKMRFALVTHYDVTTQGGVYNSVVWYRDIILWAWFPRRRLKSSMLIFCQIPHPWNTNRGLLALTWKWEIYYEACASWATSGSECTRSRFRF